MDGIFSGLNLSHQNSFDHPTIQDLRIIFFEKIQFQIQLHIQSIETFGNLNTELREKTPVIFLPYRLSIDNNRKFEIELIIQLNFFIFEDN